MRGATRRVSRRWWPRSRRRAGRCGGIRTSRRARNSTTRSTTSSTAATAVWWSGRRPRSTSRWVRGEAREAADRGVLVPVRFDDARLPMDVRAIHTTDLDGWGDDPGSPPFQALLRALDSMIARQAATAGAAGAAASSAGARPARDRDLRAAVRQHERRPRAGILQRRHHRGHHHRPEQGLGARRRLAQHARSCSRASTSTCRRSRASSRSATCSRAACARPAAACASPPS